MKHLKGWQQVAMIIFGAGFLMFTVTALRGNDWILWLYPAVALVGIGITLWDGPGRKAQKEEQAAERARADKEEMKRAQRMARKQRRRGKEGN